MIRPSIYAAMQVANSAAATMILMHNPFSRIGIAVAALTLIAALIA